MALPWICHLYEFSLSTTGCGDDEGGRGDRKQHRGEDDSTPHGSSRGRLRGTGDDEERSVQHQTLLPGVCNIIRNIKISSHSAIKTSHSSVLPGNRNSVPYPSEKKSQKLDTVPFS